MSVPQKDWSAVTIVVLAMLGAVAVFAGLAVANDDPRIGAEFHLGVLGLILVVVGWYTTTKLAADSQRQFLHLQLLNESRQAIVTALRAEETRLGALSSLFSMLNFVQEITPVVRASTVEKAHRLLSEDSSAWVFALEERAALYPELRPCRIQMVRRQHKLHDEARRILHVLNAPGAIDRHLITAATELAGHASEQASLMHDVIVHAQARAFSSVSGHPVEKRDPPDDGVIRLVERDNALHVDVVDKAARARLKVGGWLPTADA